MDEFDTIGKRITKIRQVYCDGKNTPFAERIGKDTSYSSQICNGTKTPGRSVLEEILAAFPEVSRPWLYFGEGKMLLADAEKSLLAKEDAPSYEKTLPLIPYDAFAGLPAVDNIGVAFKDCDGTPAVERTSLSACPATRWCRSTSTETFSPAR